MAKPSKRGTRLKGAAGRWPGGRIYLAADGTKVFEIRRMVNGRRYEVSTGCTSLRPAMKQLERFESDPDGYRPEGDPATLPLYLDADPVDENMQPDPAGLPRLVREFLRWSRDEKGNTPEWVAKQKALLAWWLPKLHRVDLRRASVRDHILPALKDTPGRAQRIEVIKAFYGWLRKHRHLIAPHEDPCFGTLVGEQARPAQWKRSKVIPREHYLLALEHLAGGPWRDALVILAGTGWHVSELMRFATGGEIEPLPKAMRVENGAMGVLTCPRHKTGDVHRTAVSADVLAAAQRLRERGWPADSKFPFYDAIASACRAAKIPRFNPGAFRHSTATWAVQAGAPVEAVSAFLGHRSIATTKRFYATLAVVPKIPTLA